MLIILGDFNATLIKSDSYKFTMNTHENRNTSYFSDFLSEYDLIPINTIFDKKISNLITFKFNERNATLDYILLRKKWTSSAIDCYSTEPPINSDHNLLLSIIKWKLKNNKNTQKSIKNFSSINSDLNLRNNFISYITSNIKIDSDYSNFVKIINKSYDLLLPNKSFSNNNNPWENINLIPLRSKIKNLPNKIEINKDLLKNYNEQLNNQYHLNTLKDIENKCTEIFELNESESQSKKVWDLIFNLTGYKNYSKIGIISAKDNGERINLWFNHFNNLLNPNINSINNINNDDNIKINLTTEFNNQIFNTNLFNLNELNSALNKLSNGKACGIDNIYSEILKLDEIKPFLLNLLNSAYINNKLPDDWLTSVLIPIHKKGSKNDCNNYRGIALMSLTAKLFNKLLLMRLSSIIDPLLRYNQNGFRRKRSTTQHVLAAKRIIEEVKDSADAKLIAIFIDFSKAFDSINWNWIKIILKSYNVPDILINAIMSMYNGSKAKVKVDNDNYISKYWCTSRRHISSLSIHHCS